MTSQQEKFDPRKFFEHTEADEKEFEKRVEEPKLTPEQITEERIRSAENITRLQKRDLEMRSAGFESVAQKLAARGIPQEKLAGIKSRVFDSAEKRDHLEVIQGGKSAQQIVETPAVNPVSETKTEVALDAKIETVELTPFEESKQSFADAVNRWKKVFADGEDVSTIDKELTKLSKDVLRLASDDERRGFAPKGTREKAMAELIAAKKEMDIMRRSNVKKLDFEQEQAQADMAAMRKKEEPKYQARRTGTTG